MIKSMTGFGKASAEFAGKKITIEVRALNSKQLDISMRLPQLFREKEYEIRAEIGKAFERGKVDFSVSLDQAADSQSSGINKDVARKYYFEILALAEELKSPVGDNLLPALLKLPEVLLSEQDNLDEDSWEAVKGAIVSALELADRFRLEEGRLLEDDLKCRVDAILRLLKLVEPFEAARIQNLRERFERNQAEFLASRPGIDKFDENRFEQEIFWYLEKLDITEEKIRLDKHCHYFIETLAQQESNGRKLAFITQEIGREINTLGSKASDADIQRIVVQMKDELEKIKEQLNNIL